MQKIEVTAEVWAALLAAKQDRPLPVNAADPALALYGPITASKSLVLAQVGQSLDGRVATPAGDARDISGPDGIAHLHRLRALVDAVIVGVGTVRADNPRLSVRAVAGPSPVRVVIDCRAELTGEEGLFHDAGAPVIVIQGADAPRTHHQNAEILRLPQTERGLDPRHVIEALNTKGLRRILIEGGARTIARFIEAGTVDLLHVTIAPLIIGSGPTGIALPPIDRLSAARRPQISVYTLGSDVLFDCSLKIAEAGTASFEPGEARLG